MNIAAFLETKAHNLATAKQAEANTIKTELEEIEREKLKLQAKFDAMRHAVKRAINFRPRIGTDYQCPRCWINNEAASALTPVPGTRYADIFRCSACASEFVIPCELKSYVDFRC